MELHRQINKFLADHYGLSLSGRPKFRLVWSEDLYETRKGLFSPVAVFEEVRKAPKYMMFSDRWVLEVDTLAFQDVFGRAIEAKREIVKEGDGYEFLRVFQSKDGEYLKPDLGICKIICDSWIELVNRPEGQRLSRKKASYNDAQKMKEEVQKFYELLSADDSDLISRFHDKEAVIIHREVS